MSQLACSAWLRHRFLPALPYPEADDPPPEVQLVQNWYEEVSDRKHD